MAIQTLAGEGCFTKELKDKINSNFAAPVPIATPSAANAAGTAGQICADASYVYICVATNTWLRASIATW